MTNLTFPYPPFPKTFSNSKSDGPSFSFGFTVSWHNGTFSTSSPNFSILKMQFWSRTNRTSQNKKKTVDSLFRRNSTFDVTYSICKNTKLSLFRFAIRELQFPIVQHLTKILIKKFKHFYIKTFPKEKGNFQNLVKLLRKFFLLY